MSEDGDDEGNYSEEDFSEYFCDECRRYDRDGWRDVDGIIRCYLCHANNPRFATLYPDEQKQIK